MRERIRPVLAALSFLSAVPVGRAVELGPRDLRRSAALLPIVGGVVGALVALVAWASAQVLPTFVAAVLGIAAGVAVTAALHLDGLGDVADLDDVVRRVDERLHGAQGTTMTHAPSRHAPLTLPSPPRTWERGVKRKSLYALTRPSRIA